MYDTSSFSRRIQFHVSSRNNYKKCMVKSESVVGNEFQTGVQKAICFFFQNRKLVFLCFCLFLFIFLYIKLYLIIILYNIYVIIH